MFNTHDERLSSTHCIGCFMQAPEKHLCVAAASVRASHRLSMASPLFGCQNLQSFVKNLNKIEQIEWLECGIPPTQGLNPPTRLQPISFNAGSEGDLTSAGNQHSWRSVLYDYVTSDCQSNQAISQTSANISLDTAGRNHIIPWNFDKKSNCDRMDYVCGNFLASRLVQPKQKATTPTPKLRQLCPGSPPVNDPSELVVPLTLFVIFSSMWTARL